jgi:hypothetical protein
VLEAACTLSIAKPPSYDPEDTYHIFVLNTSTQEWEDEGGTDQGGSVTLSVTQCRTHKLGPIEE